MVCAGCVAVARSEDMTVNPMREKKLTNVRAAGSDANILLKPPRQMALETALEYIEEDELVEGGARPVLSDPCVDLATEVVESFVLRGDATLLTTHPELEPHVDRPLRRAPSSRHRLPSSALAPDDPGTRPGPAERRAPVSRLPSER